MQNDRVRRRRVALALTSALVSLDAGQALAESVTVSASDNAASVNALILAAEAKPAADIAVTISSPAVISGGDIFLSPLAAGQGDGAIAFTNTGSIGTVKTGVITDYVGVGLYGKGVASAANTATVNNTGVITNGLNVASFGGAVSIVNGGTVYGGVFANGFGDVSVTTGPTGSIVASSPYWAVYASADATKKSVTTENVTTTTATGGNATVDQQGNALLADGGRAHVATNAEAGNATVNVGGKAGLVYADAGSYTPSTVVSSSQEAKVGATTTTSQFDVAYGDHDATVTIGTSGDVSGAFATASGDATVTVAGKVGSNGASATALTTDTTYKYAVTLDASGNLVGTSENSSSKRSGGAAAVTIGASGSVDASVLAQGNTGATVIVEGDVAGDANAVQSGSTDTTFAQTVAYGADAVTTKTDMTSARSAGTASVAVGGGAAIDGGVSAVANRDAGVTNAVGGVVKGSIYVDAQPGTDVTSTETVVASTKVSGDGSTDYASTSTSVGGAASLANAGYIGGDATLFGLTGATVTNTGQIAGSTYVSTGGAKTEIAGKSSQLTTVVSGVSTQNRTASESTTTTAIQGDVTGTYSGTNGQVSFSPIQQGNITQSASGNSTANVSGTVYGSVTSTAGTLDNSTTTSANTAVLVIDGAKPANNTYAFDETTTSSSTNNAGTSTVNISGRLSSDTFGTTTVTSTGTSGSVVNVSGKVDGSVTSAATGLTTSTSTTTTALRQAGASFVTVLNSGESSGSSAVTGGAAQGSVTGTGTIDGSLSVSGVSLASAQVDAGATVGGSLSVGAFGSDTSYVSSDVTTYDPVADEGVREFASSGKSGPAAASGDATANVDGHVNGSVSVDAAKGNAAATIGGQVNGSVSVSADGTTHEYADTSSYAGKGDSLSLTASTSHDRYTHAGGTASVTVATSAEKQAAHIGSDLPSVGSVYANGFTGATVTIAEGSRVGGDAQANSVYFDVDTTTSTTYAHGTGAQVYTYAYAPVGGTASVVNDGVVDGLASANGRSVASVVNNGKAGSLSASALDESYAYQQVDNDIFNINPATHTIDRTWTYAPSGGAATIDNAGEAGDVYLSGASGSLTNSGKITGQITLGNSVTNGTFTQKVTSATTDFPTPAFVPSESLFAQTYTVEQNGTLEGDIHVQGADVTISDTVYKTSTVAATINLNTGSVTTGTIIGENDTDTVVNVKGGDLLLVGAPYVPASVTNAVPTYSAGLVGGATGGSFALNVASSTVQVKPAYDLTLENPLLTFGLNGNVTVGAGGKLVVGVVTEHANVGAGASIVAVNPTVEGANLHVSGNFASTGTVVVGVNGSLVQSPRFAQSVQDDFLAPIVTTIGSFGTAYTTPEATGNPINTASSVSVGGNLDLGGKIQVYVPKGSIFLGDGSEDQTLFTVGGTIANTASVETNLPSNFVTLAPVTVDKTVVLKVSRASYATAADNRNAAAAAVALDKAIPGVVRVLTADAVGQQLYSSLAQLSKVQDVANIVSNLDWTLNKTAAAQVFNELASASIYGSLANLHQNVAFEGQMDLLAQRREDGEAAIGLWIAPVGNFAKFSGGSSGAARIDATSYGAAIGLDIGYGANGGFGIGFGYAKHNVDARNGTASVDGDTYTLGAYWTHGFGPLAVNAKVAYGFSKFDGRRDLALLSRQVTGHFRGSELDGSLGLAYKLEAGGFDVTPFADLSVRHWHLNSFTEAGGAGVGLAVEGKSKTVFDPELGVRLSTLAVDSNGLKLRPYGSLSYTFQGNAGTSRQVGFEGDIDANTFVLEGVSPKGYGTVGLGMTAVIADKVNLSVGGSYAFGSGNNTAAIRSVIGFRF